MTRVERIDLRLQPEEKDAFQQAADLAGTSLSSWMRERLRRVAAKELEEARRIVPFLRWRQKDECNG